MSVRIGVDLGTTNSAVAMVYDDGPGIVPRDGMNRIFEPSVVRFDAATDRWTAGEDADQGVAHAVRSIKRLMGRTYSEAMDGGAAQHFESDAVKLAKLHHDDLRLQLLDDDGEQVAAAWPPEVCAHILKALKMRAERELGADVEAVVTVPAYFEDAHRAATLEAARLAGLTVLEPLLDEPTAAALAFSHIIGLALGEPLLVVDWGGGTLDVTVLMSDGEGFTQLAIDGDLYLGGDDLDLALAHHVLTGRQLSVDLLQSPVNRYRLLKEVRSVKHRLSDSAIAKIVCVLDGPGADAITINQSVTRDDFERLALPFVERVAAIVQRCLGHRDVPAGEIRNVLLVGGSTLMPSVRARLQGLLPHAALRTDLDPMHAVALGAAVYAEMQRDSVVRICPYGYGVLTTGGSIDLIGCGHEVPTPEHQPYRIAPALVTAYDNQTVFRLTLQRFTKHSESVRDVARLGSVRVFGRNLPPRPKGTPVDCEFWLDQNKVLRGRSRIDGGEPIEMDCISLAEVGSRAALTQLKDRCLEVEALIEGNAARDTPLLARLADAWKAANTAIDANAVEDGGRCLVIIEDVIAQVRSAAAEKPGPNSDEKERARVLDWMRFYEQSVLPRYGHLFDRATLTTAVEAITRIRLMSRTGASGEEMADQLRALERPLAGGRTGYVVSAYRASNVAGVSASLTRQIEQLCDRASSELRQAPATPGSPTAEALKVKAAEAREQGFAWQASAGISLVTPDLVRGVGDDSAV